MKKNEESEKEIEKKENDKRKESVSSSKSEEASETDSYQNDYIPIKKETSHYQIIDNKLFNKIIQYIKDINTFQQQLKSGKIIPKQTTKVIYDSSQFTKSLTNEFSIISNKQNEKQNLNQDNENNNNNLYKSSDNVIKVNNPNTSIMNLFMNANKVKEKDKEEILKLKTDLAEITKKTETEIDNYKTVINDLTLKIATLEKELKDIKDINMKLIARQNINKTAFGIIYTNEKLLTKILSYLETQEKFDFSKSNSFLYKNIFFKAVSENLLKIVKKKNYILEKLSGEDLNTKFDVKETEILDLFREYIFFFSLNC